METQVLVFKYRYITHTKQGTCFVIVLIARPTKMTELYSN